MTTLLTVEHSSEGLWWSLQELTTSTQLAPDFVVQCVDCGVMEVSGPQVQWRFNSDARQRLQRAWRLHRDLELHINSLPVVLDLLEELETLREEAKRLRGRLQHWEQEE